MIKKLFVLVGLLISVGVADAQNHQYYKARNGSMQLCGPFHVEALEKDTTFNKWYSKNYAEFSMSDKNSKWARNLKDVKVEIYMGTWCGDSQTWVPQFVKLWDALGLRRDQLHFTALYGSVEGKTVYKQGPNHEERGKRIHKVPTFIFTKNGEEIARIVETPVTDLETDVAQIALGYPTKENYPAASYMFELFDTKTMDEINANKGQHYYAVRHLVNNSGELNTLGYVLLEAGCVEEALLTFYFNSLFFKNDPNVYDSYGEALAMDGQVAQAIEMYERVLLLDRSNTNAKEQLKKLRAK